MHEKCGAIKVIVLCFYAVGLEARARLGYSTRRISRGLEVSNYLTLVKRREDRFGSGTWSDRVWWKVEDVVVAQRYVSQKRPCARKMRRNYSRSINAALEARGRLECNGRLTRGIYCGNYLHLGKMKRERCWLRALNWMKYITHLDLAGE